MSLIVNKSALVQVMVTSHLSITWTYVDQNVWHHNAAPCHNELIWVSNLMEIPLHPSKWWQHYCNKIFPMSYQLCCCCMCKILSWTNHQEKNYHKCFPHVLDCEWKIVSEQGAVSIRKTVLPGMAIPMLKIRRPNGRLIFNMEITIRR